MRGRGSGRGRGRGREGGAGSACGVRRQRVEGERASWQGGFWGWQWVGAAVVAEVGEEVEAVVAGEWKQGLARGSGEGGGPVNWTWCCCYLHAALSTGAADLLSSRRSAHLRRCLEHWCSRSPVKPEKCASTPNRGGGRPSSQSTSASDRAPVGEGEAVAVDLVEDDGEEVQGLVS